MRRRGSQVRADQGSFQVIQCGAIDFFVEGNCFFNALSEILSRAGYRFLHAIEEARLLFQAAEKGLNHKNP